MIVIVCPMTKSNKTCSIICLNDYFSDVVLFELYIYIYTYILCLEKKKKVFLICNGVMPKQCHLISYPVILSLANKRGSWDHLIVEPTFHHNGVIRASGARGKCWRRIIWHVGPTITSITVLPQSPSRGIGIVSFAQKNDPTSFSRIHRWTIHLSPGVLSSPVQRVIQRWIFPKEDESFVGMQIRPDGPDHRVGSRTARTGMVGVGPAKVYDW